jgi:glycosyltransferase involved in cell wall biosynthesis
MPAFNAAATIADSIDCVLGQTCVDVELLVVDDGSTDDTVRIVADYVERHGARVRLLHQDHRGPYPARNLALRGARGEFVAFLDADDTWRADCLERLLAALRNGEADLAYCGWQNVGPAAPGTQPFVPPAYEEGDLGAACLRSCPWPIHAALTRRSALEAIGGFSERLFTSMDYDLWIRLIAHSQKLVRVPEVLAFYHWRGNQISSDRSRQVLNSVQVRRDFIADHPAFVAHLDAATRRRLVDGYLMDRAYQAFWRRELRTAQTLLRAALRAGSWRVRDLPYIALAALPPLLFDRLLSSRDAASRQGSPR